MSGERGGASHFRRSTERASAAPRSKIDGAGEPGVATPVGRSQQSQQCPADALMRPAQTTWRTELTARLDGRPPPLVPVPCTTLITGVAERASCVIEVGASKHVHCPSIASCRSANGRCSTVHFGYAIPVLVEAQGVVLDEGAELDPRAARYLLEHHPQLVNRTQAGPSDRMHLANGTDGGKMALDPNELYNQLMRQNAAEHDMQAIAKHISDHAEAIYQTWKSKGLTPNELLHLHSSDAPPPPTPTPQQQQPQPAPTPSVAPHRPKESLSPVELLASPQLEATLEQLVNSFVQEDKARVAARSRTASPSPQATAAAASTIQAALKRFESQQRGVSPARTPKATSFHEAVQTDDSVKSRTLKLARHGAEPSKATHVTQVVHHVAAATAAPAQSSEIEAEEEKLVNALKTGQVIDVPGPSSERLAKKMRDRQQQQQQRRSLPDAEAELESLVDRLKSMDRREGSPAVRQGSPSRAMSNVDYAKVRYQAAQAHPLTQQRLDDVKSLAKTQGGAQQANLVSETRTRFEGPTLLLNSNRPVANSVAVPWRCANTAQTEWSPVRPPGQEDASPAGLDAARRVKARKSRKSPEPAPLTTLTTLPHPELTQQQKQHLRERSLQHGQLTPTGTPIRPFLTRGSVAERVLIFEKCPAAVASEHSAAHYHHAKATTERAPSVAVRNAVTASVARTSTATTVTAAKQRPEPARIEDGAACGCPLYWKSVLFIASGGEAAGHVTRDAFLEFWKKMMSNYHDEASRFVRLLTVISPNHHGNGVVSGNVSPGRAFLVPEDFVPLIQDVVDTHPGLTFLKEAAEFHSRYVHTVIARIFYNVNRSWSGQISLAELRHSNLLSTIRVLEDEEDINQITDYFSYEHFYVIYCKFWELDKDHDLFIDKRDLARHNDHALSSKIIDRIFSGAVTRGASGAKLTGGIKAPAQNAQPRMSYTEFVWFLVSEEDKRHPTAIEYWFRCMDLDGDGFLSMYELEYFYEEQLQRMESLGIETLPFEDCLCQMLDMIHPSVPGKVSLNDLKRCQMTPIFFDTFFNLEKYLDHEQRDPFASQRDPDAESDEPQKLSDWDRYAAEEYELLVAEEGGPDHNDDMYMRDDVASPDGDASAAERDVVMSDTDLNESSDYSHLVGMNLANSGHRPLFSVTPCPVEYHY
uniref:EOG090X00JH n=1 Tax=Moina brachiata TaxID=675436 RepID=A0A4Y7NHZ4_9CRUS|nr:EOG090X00JH [Moina brachiata]SVE92839.1 EOG090X00JH [Moina brachiata]